MDLQLKYCRSADGTRIAYAVLGQGPPLIYMPWYPMSCELESKLEDCARWYERLASFRTLVLYDGRGTGASQRDVRDFGIDAMVSDLAAVADALAPDKFSLVGTFHTAAVALAYSWRHPARVEDLVLWRGYASASDWLELPQVTAISAMVGQDWVTFTEAMAAASHGWSAGAHAHEHARMIRESMHAEAWSVFYEQGRRYDVTPYLPEIKVSTLVVHRRDMRQPPIETVRSLAAMLPNARLAMCEGETAAIYLGDSCAMDAAAEFLGGASGTTSGADVRTLLFTDLVGHTEMMSRLGDEKGREVLREHERITRDVLKEHGGTEVKTMGDGFMASFGSVTRAVECAIALQWAFAAREGEPLSVRVGLNAGEPIEEEGDLFGATVILASRIAAKAEGGEILVSDNVRSLCSGKGFLFADRGEFVAKGFEEPVRVYEVSWGE